MSINFSANQYEKPFNPTSLQNWEVPKGFGRHPNTKDGCTRVISSGKGHLLPGVKRSRTSPWGTFVGTWDMPTNIPGNGITNHTARTQDAIEHLYSLKAQGDLIMSGQLKRCKVPDPLPVKADNDASQAVGRMSDVRSGAKNPIPQSTSPKPATPCQQVVLPCCQDDINNNNNAGIATPFIASKIPTPQNLDVIFP